MSDLKIYFRDSEDHIRRWFKDTYQTSGSIILKDYITSLYQNSNTNLKTPGQTPEEHLEHKLTQLFSDISDIGTEKAWLSDLATARIDPIDIIQRRLTDLKTKTPHLAQNVDTAFRKLYPTLAKIANI